MTARLYKVRSFGEFCTTPPDETSLSTFERTILGRCRSGTESAPTLRGNWIPEAREESPRLLRPCSAGESGAGWKGIAVVKLTEASSMSANAVMIRAAVLVRRPANPILTQSDSPLFNWASPLKD